MEFKSMAVREVKGNVYITSQVAHQAGAYPGFGSMKQLGVFLLPPGWHASLLLFFLGDSPPSIQKILVSV